MNRRLATAAGLTLAAYGLLASIHAHVQAMSTGKREPLVASVPSAIRLPLHATRLDDSDLEVTGLVEGLSPDASAYVRYRDILALPQVTVGVHGDENFPSATGEVRVSGVPLEAFAHAVGASTASDLIDASCVDNYRTHYPASYVRAHHPILGLKVEGDDAEIWAKRGNHRSAGRYFITHADFIPAFTILTHRDEPQVPTGVVRMHFTTASATYAAITPGAPTTEAAQAGFAIAKQNCLRCHNQGVSGGTKAGVDWSTLSLLARQQPSFFEKYIRDPKSIAAGGRMPGNPVYDDATLHALTAYFRSIGSPSSKQESEMHHE